MKSLRDILKESEKKGRAIGHFNVSDLSTLYGILDAAQAVSTPRKKVPIIIGTSEGEREFLGVQEIVALVKALRRKHKWPLFLNADHTRDVAKAKAAIDAGYDAALFDGGKLPLAENIRQTKEVVEYARASGRDIVVEGEMGYIGSSSEVLERIPEGAAIAEKDLTTPEDAARFVRETNVDMFAPAVGNFHGIVRGAQKTALNFERIRAIRDAVKVPLVLHGGSSTPDEDLASAIRAGVSVIHISTELRVAWRKGMEESLAAHPNEVAPYKLMTASRAAVREVARQRLAVFTRR